MFDRHADRGQPGGDVAVAPVALHGRPDESATVHMDHEGQGGPVRAPVVLAGGRPVDPDRDLAVGQRHPLPGDLGTGVRLPGERRASSDARKRFSASR
ncbi:hypothetical protein [Streptomyces sp. cg35]|uniref:hypothetical protein n=1 Tax=Streptomyces sp. cg35 TaxID=3421650 RepID=UPI003D1710DD